MWKWRVGLESTRAQVNLGCTCHAELGSFELLFASEQETSLCRMNDPRFSSKEVFLRLENFHALQALETLLVER